MEPPPVVDDVSKPSRKGKHLIQYPSFLKRGMLVSFRNITYTVTNEADKKEQISLLQNVSGYLRPGELIALMGPSGSGTCSHILQDSTFCIPVFFIFFCISGRSAHRLTFSFQTN